MKRKILLRRQLVPWALHSTSSEESSAPGGYKMELILGPIGTTARAATHPSLSLKAKLVAD